MIKAPRPDIERKNTKRERTRAGKEDLVTCEAWDKEPTGRSSGKRGSNLAIQKDEKDLKSKGGGKGTAAADSGSQWEAIFVSRGGVRSTGKTYRGTTRAPLKNR